MNIGRGYLHGKRIGRCGLVTAAGAVAQIQDGVAHWMRLDVSLQFDGRKLLALVSRLLKI